jgi:mono/diheme cytochrome c family protein
MKKSLFIVAAMTCFGTWHSQAETKVDFAKDIQPIFQQSCVKCHGPEKQKADLRLDSKADAMKGGKDGVVIVPGQADKSELYKRVTLAPGSDDIMPPKGDPLTKAQTDLLKDWINQGAVWPEGAVAKAAAPEASATKSESAPSSPLAGLKEVKPTSAEAGAITKIEAAGVSVRPVAMNLNWREANFHMQGTNVTDATIAPLKDIVTLVDLNLGGTRVTDAGLQNIAGLTNLVMLHLEHTKITDAGLAQLKNLKHLSYLNLYDTAVSDKGLAELKDLGNLKRLFVWETKVTDQGAADLQKSLPKVEVSRGWENDPMAKKEDKKDEKMDDKKEEKKEGKKQAKKGDKAQAKK